MQIYYVSRLLRPYYMAAESEEAGESPLPPRDENDHGTAEAPEIKKNKIDNAQQPDSQQADTLADGGGRKTEPVDVEIVQPGEWEFLDSVTRLATLQSEFEDVRNGLMVRRGLDRYVPLRLYRHWGHRVLSVTDLSGGMWCEVQLEYRHLHPHLKNSKAWTEMAEKGSPVVLKTETMKKGSVVHMNKELEVHEIVKVPSATKEDRLAIQLITTYNQLVIIKTGRIERELAVFGDPFELGVLVRGVIDQLQYSPETGELTLTDNKTRRSKSMPSLEQMKGTHLQLMLYKYVLDHMCLGTTKPELLYKHLHLDPDAVLTQGPVEYVHSCGLTSLFSDMSASNSSGMSGLKFGTVVDRTLQHIAGLGLPLVGSLMVQYEHQGSGEVLGVVPINYDEQWMKAEVEKSLEFWDGTRPPRGVDIEEAALKCGHCQFRDICVWRLQRELDTSPAAKLASP